jgi:hypothetical protein
VKRLAHQQDMIKLFGLDRMLVCGVQKKEMNAMFSGILS